MTPDLSCYVVLDEALCGSLGLAETARQAVLGGAGVIQLRMKEASTEDRIDAGRSVQSAIAGRALFVVNDDVEAAIALDADGVHVGQGDMPPEDVRARIGSRKLLGLSVETVIQARRVDRDLVDHIGAGPVRATATKPGHAPPIGWDGLADVVAAAQRPAVAIGGMTALDAEDAVRAGAAGLAVVSAVCGTPVPKDSARAVFQAVQIAKGISA